MRADTVRESQLSWEKGHETMKIMHDTTQSILQQKQLLNEYVIDTFEQNIINMCQSCSNGIDE